MLAVVPVMALLVFAWLKVGESLAASDANDSCPAQAAEITGHAVMLLDLRKPFAAAYGSLPGSLLQRVTRSLEANTELRVYALSQYAEAPRMLLGRLCKPYNGNDLAIGAAKDQGIAVRGCDNLPAQIPGAVRVRAERFCAERDALERRIGALVNTRAGSTVANAYLVEALEETSRDFEGLEKPRSLYVFSDMMQHSHWYSHLDIRWDRWNHEAFAAQREGRAPFLGADTRPDADTGVRIFYVARKDVTEHPRPRLAHRRFWERYFGDSPVEFELQTPLLAYAGERLMNIPTEEELAAEEQARARFEREELERMRAGVDRQRTALQDQRAQLEEQQRQWQLRETALRREQERLQDRERELAAERERLALNTGSSS